MIYRSMKNRRLMMAGLLSASAFNWTRERKTAGSLEPLCEGENDE
jgi:hypothetical protein